MDLTSKPLSPYKVDRHEMRISLAKSADMLRMDGKLCRAEKMYRLAARYADMPGAREHLVRLADHCRQIYNRSRK